MVAASCGSKRDDDVEVVVVGDQGLVAHHGEHRAEPEGDVGGDLAQRLDHLAGERHVGGLLSGVQYRNARQGPWMVHSSSRDGSSSALTIARKALTRSGSSSARFTALRASG